MSFRANTQSPMPQAPGNSSDAQLPTPDPAVRVFTMPEALRGRETIFMQGEGAPPAPVEVQHVFVPVPVPMPAESVPESLPRRRVSPALIIVFVLMFLGAGGAGVWWYVSVYAKPQEVGITPEPIPEPEPVTPLTPPPTPTPGTDTDTDGLSNVEELLYGTDFRSPDSDGDTYLDGNEVFHRYDPNGLAPSTLLDTGAVRVLERADVPYTLYYPASWTVTQAEKTITFRAPEGAVFMLAVEDKDLLTTLSAWMKGKEISSKKTEETMTKEGYAARTQNDGRTMYLDGGEWVLTATYTLPESQSIEFLQTFKMMMNSVKSIVKSSEPLSPPNP